MVRLAFANNLKLHTFYSGLLHYKKPIWNRDIDRSPSFELIDVLHRQTGQPVAGLRSMVLESLRGLLFDSVSSVANTSWVLPLGIFHRTHRRTGMQFCPGCLSEDVIPYYRLHWRLAFHVVCPVHWCHMLAACPACHSPITYHRHGIGRERLVEDGTLIQCSKCHFDLRHAAQSPFQGIDRESEQMMMNIIAAGNGFYAVGCGDLFSRNVLLFKGLHTLLNVMHGQHARRIVKPLMAMTSIGDELLYSYSHTEFAHRDIDVRRHLINMLSWLLVDWPGRFVRVCEAGGMSRSRISDDVGTLPYWLAAVVNSYLDRRSYVPSAKEVEGARAYLISRGENVTAKSIARTLGVAPSMGWLLKKL